MCYFQFYVHKSGQVYVKEINMSNIFEVLEVVMLIQDLSTRQSRGFHFLKMFLLTENNKMK